MPELNAILIEHRKQVSEERKFVAALKGIDLDAGATEDALERVKDNARKRVEELTGEKQLDSEIAKFIENGLDYEDLMGVDNG